MNLDDHPFKPQRRRYTWGDWCVLVLGFPIWLLGILGTLAIWALVVLLDWIEGYRMPARTWEDDYLDTCRRLRVANLPVPDRDNSSPSEEPPLKEDRPE